MRCFFYNQEAAEKSISWPVRARDKPARRASPQDAVSAAPGFYYSAGASGKSVATSAFRFPRCTPACGSSPRPSPVYRCMCTRRPMRAAEKSGDHPLTACARQANTEMTSFVWREVMLSHLLLYARCPAAARTVHSVRKPGGTRLSG